ncbi:unnamed protein product [Didymodactylos carnosus]|uniref:Uncharacterized protein n=1 Tax=Didymodactylos carnosus TaxID=1234261 RepID=A0A815HG02_9BILA|nr:unnamed protein product [Didymodactylos carnosus]CAF1351970.1 unnamed protein product [Didymodactylos carnosus]CAF3693470.1 unnamed protein product [Didymodactylos carnosus]CAF4222784.1 unnamed protein product [Didymodactylos carnosus]
MLSSTDEDEEPLTTTTTTATLKLSDIFQYFYKQKTVSKSINSYSISQTTLEQVFVLLVKEHENEQQMRSPIINFDGDSAVKTGVSVSVMRRTTTEQNGDGSAIGNIVTRL